MSDDSDNSRDSDNSDDTCATGDKKTGDEECSWCSCGGHRYKTGRAYWIAVTAVSVALLVLYVASRFI
jgi:hypothetical protein